MLSDHVECPLCQRKIKIDMTEPGEWCSDENIPDGEYIDECSHCEGKVKIHVEWRPYFGAEKIEQE